MAENFYIEKLVAVRRIAKVVSGGRILSFSALVIVGNGKGAVGFASAKAREVSDAIKKAAEIAKKNMIKVPLRESRTIHHNVSEEYKASKVILRPAPSGVGIIVGGPLRYVFEALGVRDIVGKYMGPNNSWNMVRTTFEALKSMVSPRYIAGKRGIRVGDIVSRRG